MTGQPDNRRSDDQRFEVRHDASASRYVLLDHGEAGGSEPKQIGEERYLDVAAGDETHRIMHHTAVSEEYGGQGLAAVLVRQAVEDTIAHDAAIVPVCPYVVKWLEKHPEYSQHVIAVRPEHLRALRG